MKPLVSSHMLDVGFNLGDKIKTKLMFIVTSLVFHSPCLLSLSLSLTSSTSPSLFLLPPPSLALPHCVSLVLWISTPLFMLEWRWHKQAGPKGQPHPLTCIHVGPSAESPPPLAFGVDVCFARSNVF